MPDERLGLWSVKRNEGRYESGLKGESPMCSELKEKARMKKDFFYHTSCFLLNF